MAQQTNHIGDTNKMITAVEWLWHHFNVSITRPSEEMLEQAKEMEKHQHGITWNEAINTHEERGHVIARSIVDFDDYYNENYGK